LDLESTIVAVNHHGHILVEETICYGNLTNSNNSIGHSGYELTGEAIGDNERILLELDRIPSKVLTLYILLTVFTPSKTFNNIKLCLSSIHFHRNKARHFLTLSSRR